MLLKLTMFFVGKSHLAHAYSTVVTDFILD